MEQRRLTGEEKWLTSPPHTYTPHTPSKFTVMSEAMDRRTGPALECVVSAWLGLYTLSLWTSCGGNLLLSPPFSLPCSSFHPLTLTSSSLVLDIGSMYHSDFPNLNPTHAPFLLFVSPSSSFSLSPSQFSSFCQSLLEKAMRSQRPERQMMVVAMCFHRRSGFSEKSPAGVAS